MDEIEPKLIMHDDNTAMIQVCRSAKNPQMKNIGCTFGVSIRSLHEATQRDDFELGPIQSEFMVADIHTKAYPESRATEWNNVRCNAGVFSEEEVEERIGTAGLGWLNRAEEPGKYITRKRGVAIMKTIRMRPKRVLPMWSAMQRSPCGQGWMVSLSPSRRIVQA